MPTISVVIPVYNGQETILNTINSVLEQSFSDFELIVINSASTDSTLEIVSHIKDPRLQVFSYPKANVAVNRNLGFKHASGEFITFLDADDLWTIDKLEAQYKALQDNPKATVAYSWSAYIDAEDKFLKAGKQVTVTGDVYSKLLLGNFLENGSNPLIRREAIETLGGFDESLAAAQDWDMWLRLAAHYEFVVVPKAQILYRVSAHSMSANVLRLEAASLKVIQRAFSHQKAEKIQKLKKYSFANLYQYLTFKALEAAPSKQVSWVSARFLWNWVQSSPSILQQRKIILIVLLKITFPWLYYRLRQLRKGEG
jgi:glycosyltransferase involved in cell wall biosynthesis